MCTLNPTATLQWDIQLIRKRKKKVIKIPSWVWTYFICIIPFVQEFPSFLCHFHHYLTATKQRECVYLCEERDSPTPISSNSFCPHCNTTNFLFSLGFLEIDNFVLSVLGGSIMSAQIKFCSQLYIHPILRIHPFFFNLCSTLLTIWLILEGERSFKRVCVRIFHKTFFFFGKKIFHKTYYAFK